MEMKETLKETLEFFIISYGAACFLGIIFIINMCKKNNSKNGK